MISDRHRLAVNTKDAARLCGMSETRWRLLHRSGRCPAPITMGRALLWRVADLERWVADGMPARNQLQAQRYAAESTAALDGLRR